VFIIGLDLGQSQDYSALCVLERTAERGKETQYAVRHLQRWPLGTQYPVIVREVGALLDTAPLSKRDTPLVIDLTGVGRAVGDLFKSGGIRPRGITITGGDTANTEDSWLLRVPKRELVSTLVALFQSGRLKIADGLAQAPVLIRELANFKVKINIATGNDTYEAWRESIHDDLVLAVGLATWYGESRTALPFSWVPRAVPPPGERPDWQAQRQRPPHSRWG